MYGNDFFVKGSQLRIVSGTNINGSNSKRNLIKNIIKGESHIDFYMHCVILARRTWSIPPPPAFCVISRFLTKSIILQKIWSVFVVLQLIRNQNKTKTTPHTVFEIFIDNNFRYKTQKGSRNRCQKYSQKLFLLKLLVRIWSCLL